MFAPNRREFITGAAAVSAYAALGRGMDGAFCNVEPCFGGRVGHIKYTAKDYVQDGLVDIYDFKENDGWGNFNESVKPWKSLIDPTAPYFNPWGYTTSPYFRSDGKYWGLHTLRHYATGYSKISLGSADFTLELNGQTTNGVCGITGVSTDVKVKIGLLGCVTEWTTVPASFGSLARDSAPHTIRLIQKEGAIYFGADNTHSYYSYPITLSGSFSTGSFPLSPYSTSVEGGCFMNSFRIYTRALSESETSANYAIDKARFNLA